MSRRAISEAQRAWLLGEMEVWNSRGLLPPDGAARIVDLYETQGEAQDRRRSTLLFTLAGLAAFLVGVGVLLLIGYNWEAMPAALKVGAVFAAVLGAHAAGFHLRYGRGARGASEVMFFLGCLFYGAGIWLLAQVFHLDAHYPDGVWWWAVGVVPFALALESRLLHVLLAGLLGLWAGLEVLGFSDLGVSVFWLGRWGSWGNGAYTLPLMALPGLLWAYRRASPGTVGLYAPLLAWWGVLQPFAWQWGWQAFPVYLPGGIAGVLLVIAESHPPGSRFAIPYRLCGVLLLAAVLVPLSFYGLNKELLDTQGEAGLIQAIVIVTLGLAALGAAAGAQRALQGIRAWTAGGLLETARRQWFSIGVLLLMAFLAFWNSLGGAMGLGSGYGPASAEEVFFAIVPTVLVNAAMLVLGGWLLHVGLREDRGRPFTAGVLVVLVWAVLRYLDLFGEMGGMLGAAAMFFLCGGALFGVALFWRSRTRIEVGHV